MELCIVIQPKHPATKHRADVLEFLKFRAQHSDDRCWCALGGQASLRLAEEGQSAMRARLVEAERRAGEAAQLRADNAELTRSAAAARAELAARDAAQPLIDALRLELASLQACAHCTCLFGCDAGCRS